MHHDFGEAHRAQRIRDRELFQLVLDPRAAPHAGSIEQRKSRPCHSISTAMELRVVPASALVSSRSSPSRRLISVDLPALGRPTIATRIGRGVSHLARSPRRPRTLRPRRRAPASAAQRVVEIAEPLAMLGRDLDRLAQTQRVASCAGCAVLPSPLLATRTTGLLARRAKSAKAWSFGVRPARASITNINARPPDRGFGLLLHSPGQRALGALVQPGGIDDREFEIAEPPLALAAVAGDAGLVIDQRELLPTSRLNSVDLPTLGRPIMAIVNGIGDPSAEIAGFFSGKRASICGICSLAIWGFENQRAKLPLGSGAGNGAATVAAICCCCMTPAIRRRRGGAAAHDLRLGRRRRGGGAALLLRRRGVGSAARRLALLLVLPGPGLVCSFDLADLGSSGGGRSRSSHGRSARRAAAGASPCRRSFGTPCSRPGTPSGNTGLRSPGSFFLVSMKSIRSDGSKLDRPPPPQPASAPDSATRTVTAISRCDATLFDLSLSQLFRHRWQQRLQRFGPRAQPRRRVAVIGNHIQPLPRRGCIIGAPGREAQATRARYGGRSHRAQLPTLARCTMLG